MLSFALLALTATTPAPYRETVQVHALVVDVHVSDGAGRFVSGLGVDDFELYDDGLPQRIDSVREVRGLSLEPEPAESDQPPAPAETRPAQAPSKPLSRQIVFVVDGNAGAGTRARDAALRWARANLGSSDRITIASTGQRLRIDVDDQPYSEELLAALEANLRARFTQTIPLGPQLSVDGGGGGGIGAAPSQGFDRAALLARGMGEIWERSYLMGRQLEQLAARLAARPGRKTVILLSEGPLIDGVRRSLLFREFADRVAPRFMAADAQIHSIQTRPPNPFARGLSANPVLAYFSEETGGRHVYNTANFDAAMEEIGSEASNYYQLSYTTHSEWKPGSYHELGIKVRRAGVEVRHKPGYVAPRSFEQMDEREREMALESAAAGPLDRAELGLEARMVRIPLEQGRSWLGVLAVIPGEVFRDTQAADISLLLEARSVRGALLGTVRQRLHQTQALGLERGLEWLGGVELAEAPGTLRVVARDDSSGRFGVVELPYDLGNPRQRPLLLELSGGRRRVSGADPLPGFFRYHGLPLHPRMSDTLVAGETVGLLFNLSLAAEGRPAETLSLAVVDSSGTRRQLQLLGGSGSREQPRHSSLLLVARVPALAPGPCRLETRWGDEPLTRPLELECLRRE